MNLNRQIKRHANARLNYTIIYFIYTIIYFSQYKLCGLKKLKLSYLHLWTAARQSTDILHLGNGREVSQSFVLLLYLGIRPKE